VADISLTAGRVRTLEADFASGVWSAATQRFLADLLASHNANSQALITVQQIIVAQPIEVSLAPVALAPTVIGASAGDLAPAFVPALVDGDTASLAPVDQGTGLGVSPWL